MKQRTAAPAGPTTPPAGPPRRVQPARKSKLTVPQTPAMIRRVSQKKPKKKVLTHEERELEIIRQKKRKVLRKEEKERRTPIRRALWDLSRRLAERPGFFRNAEARCFTQPWLLAQIGTKPTVS